MIFAKFSVKNSMFINLMSLLIIVAGVFALFDMRKEAFPPVSFNAVYINTYFRGAAAEKVEKLVTIPLEREIRDVSNIKEIVSKSLEGMSISSKSQDLHL